MIVPMKKLSLLIFYKDYQPFLEELRERGVVHIHENKKRSLEDEVLKQKLFIIKRIGEMIKLLRRCVPVTASVSPGISGQALLEFLEGQYKRKDRIDQLILSLQKDKNIYTPWGDFSKDYINELWDAGWALRFFTISDRKYLPEWEEYYNAFIIREEKGQKYFITMTANADEQDMPDAETVVFPVADATEIRQQVEMLEKEKEEITQGLDAIAEEAIIHLEAFWIQQYQDTDEIKVTGASDALIDQKVIILEGWIPAVIETDTDQWLSERNVYYELEEPKPEDTPPILLKNNRFARLFELVGELYALPNYREIDLTPFFAPFFLLFFGICLGDAGYGLIILLGVSFFKRKAKPSVKPILSLAQWLGGATMVIGFFCGTFLGIELANITWMEKFKLVMLDSKQLFNLALIIGGIQIVFGMFIKVANLWKQSGFQAVLSTVGWLLLLLGEGCCYLLSKKGHDVTVAVYLVAIIAGMLIFLFNNLKRNIFMNIGVGIWDTYGTVTGLLGDLLSYIRLFALSISGSVLGLVFNNLATNMSGDIPVLSQIVMLIILLFGHGVNIFIASLGAFVHPMRLTFVEFYKNAGFEGGGKKYQPFKNRAG